jgi:hypothetical protein
MFGQLARTYLRRRPGRYPTYRTAGLRRYAKRRVVPRSLVSLSRPRYRKSRNVLQSRTFRIQDTTTVIQNGRDISGNPTNQTGHIAYNLDQFPHAATFKRIYNMYRIKKIKIQFIPVNTRAQIGGNLVGADSNVPTFSFFVNRISSTFPANLNQILSVPGAVQKNAGTYAQAYYSPVTFDSVYRAGVTTNALGPEWGQWLTTDYTNVNHHGVSWVMSAAGTQWNDEAFKYRVVTTIYVQFKGNKVDTTV